MTNLVAHILFGFLTVLGLASGVWYGITGAVILIAVFVHTQYENHKDREAYVNQVVADEYERHRNRANMWLGETDADKTR